MVTGYHFMVMCPMFLPQFQLADINEFRIAIYLFSFQLESWPEEFRDRMSYNIYNATFPDAGNASSLWRKMFKSCATERLFFPVSTVNHLIFKA